MDVFLNFLFYSNNLCVSFYPNAVLIIMALQYRLKSRSVLTPFLFVLLAQDCFSYTKSFCSFTRILWFFSISVKNVIERLVRMTVISIGILFIYLCLLQFLSSMFYTFQVSSFISAEQLYQIKYSCLAKFLFFSSTLNVSSYSLLAFKVSA